MIQNILRISLILAAASLWPFASAMAENSLKTNEIALSFRVANDDDFVFGGRYFVGPDWAVLGEFGFETFNDKTSGADYRLGIGVRKYLSTESEILPFLGAGFAYFSDFNESPTNPDNNGGIELDAHFGAEYFLAKRFSAEASLGVQFKTFTSGAGPTIFGTVRTALGVNYYFP